MSNLQRAFDYDFAYYEGKANFGLAEKYFETGQYDIAIKHYRKCVEQYIPAGRVMNKTDFVLTNEEWLENCEPELLQAFRERQKEIDNNIMVEQAAGITNGQQVYDFIMAGSEAAGAASGIMNAEDPIAMIDEMIAATRRAADDLKKLEG